MFKKEFDTIFKVKNKKINYFLAKYSLKPVKNQF